MGYVLGLDIGTASVGWAVLSSEGGSASGVKHMGVRIFPEALHPKTRTPLNQERRAARLRRRLLRRRRDRLQKLADLLADAGLLPTAKVATDKDSDWARSMNTKNKKDPDPYELRARAAKGEKLTPHELGRALYHLAQRRQFKMRDSAEPDEKDKDSADKDVEKKNKTVKEKQAEAEDKQANAESIATSENLKTQNITFGQYLHNQVPEKDRRRTTRALRRNVEYEFETIWQQQGKHHASVLTDELKQQIHGAIFFQRPVFWRKSTLGECPFFSKEPVCRRGSWLSQQKRMLEKVNNLRLVGGNQRELDKGERRKLADHLQTRTHMSWLQVRKLLDLETTDKFNLEEGGEKSLLGHKLENKLAKCLGDDWANHPHKQAIRDGVPHAIWEADYGEKGQRVVIRNEKERAAVREKLRQEFVDKYGITAEQAEALSKLKFEQKWEPYSEKALKAFLPKLEAGERFGDLMAGADWEKWRRETFEGYEQPTGEVWDRLPSPANKEEQERLKKIRNPAVVRAQNELRKVVNNLIAVHGKPERIRVEMTRDVGKSKDARIEIQKAISEQTKKRAAARADLVAHGFAEPSRDDIEKWLLWDECAHRCPYTGAHIGFDALFRRHEFEVEHIWPRSRSLDDSYANKTLCETAENKKKGNRMPYEYLKDTPQWEEVKARLRKLQDEKRMRRGKVKRFQAKEMPENFANRQLTDTGYAAREIKEWLKRLWPDLGSTAPVNVEVVSGQMTARLRGLWGLNGLLSEGEQKARDNHKHHALDALVVACIDKSLEQKLSRHYKLKEEGGAEKFPPPWRGIREDAAKALANIVVSHKVRKKVSGALHKDTLYGDTKHAEGKYHFYVRRKPIADMTPKEVKDIRDGVVQAEVTQWKADAKSVAAANQGKPKDERQEPPSFPRVGKTDASREIRKARYTIKKQGKFMRPVSARGKTLGYVEQGANHHVAIFRKPDGTPDGKIVYDVVSLFEAAQRLRNGKKIVEDTHSEHKDAEFVMSLSLGDALQFPPESERPGIKIVKSIKENGQIGLRDHDDAIQEKKEGSLWQPTVSSIIKAGVKKIAIDPIGRIRKAGG